MYSEIQLQTIERAYNNAVHHTWQQHEDLFSYDEIQRMFNRQFFKEYLENIENYESREHFIDLKLNLFNFKSPKKPTAKKKRKGCYVQGF